jgi:hypothetical protein
MNRVRLFLQAVLAVRCTHNVGDLAENPVMKNRADKPGRPLRATYQPLRLGRLGPPNRSSDVADLMKELCIYRLLFSLAPDLDDVLSLPDHDDGTVATNSIDPIASPSICQGPRVVSIRRTSRNGWVRGSYRVGTIASWWHYDAAARDALQRYVLAWGPPALFSPPS